MTYFEDMINFAKKTNPELHGFVIKPCDLIFEERVRMACFNCGKYKIGWKCPGHMPPNIDYQKMVNEYESGAFIYLKMPFTTLDFNEVRTESTISLHKSLLQMEKYLWERNYPMAISFIGGSCKLCKSGCGTEKCNNPYNARSSVEAIGINVVKSVAKYGLKIEFPPQNFLMRVGLILW